MKDSPTTGHAAVHSHGGGTDLAAPEGTDLENRFANPGLPAHRFRVTDTDPKAARSAERQVSTIFLLSAVGTVVFLVGYFALPIEEDKSFERLLLSTLVLGLGLGFAIFCIGIGLVHWAKTLMPDHEQIELRHDIAGTEDDRRDAANIILDGVEESGVMRRTVIRNSLIGALGILPIPAVVLFRDLGPLPGEVLRHSLWENGVRLTRDPDGTPIRAADVTYGSVFHVIPDGMEDSAHPIEEKAKAAVLLIRIQPEKVQAAPERDGWDYDGIYAYSKICTHVGCPVALYEQQTHHLLCPCHQSTFDLTQHCKVIFGPAKRPLPQLPITVDNEGYLVAQRDFPYPPGPSYWERGESE
ncbi:menaquinol-cytochrome c reductase iron-sulfur subunit precursor [Quadrisphaera granulorum]|uniref:Cytochrome bc1 complex Rieske iron-sulfur subunit n=1 Tax=Quadrisphaera granulorum TaxID=317664 RepID=A0A315ZW71_9ACTN|nr:Rieske 2Fe-2S domain-containing protein [Quadrisphaera granulorum]PWJ49876.1 menaquinol-cytochrome c reductase iron-sulfur subunit precursor [Quadrisphaera granulorum]SZE98084.1 menaquinol-cytochrome c reductase iron-sulfur subunit precursor [Quadrisphaera granulorum]